MDILQDLYDAIAIADNVGEQLSTAKQQLAERMRALYREVGTGTALMPLEAILDSIKASAKQRGFISNLTGRTNAEERETELITWCREHVKEYADTEMALMTVKAMIEMSKTTISQLATDSERAQNKVSALKYALKHQTEILRNQTENEISQRTKDLATVLQAEGNILLTKSSMIEAMSSHK